MIKWDPWEAASAKDVSCTLLPIEISKELRLGFQVNPHVLVVDPGHFQVANGGGDGSESTKKLLTNNMEDKDLAEPSVPGLRGPDNTREPNDCGDQTGPLSLSNHSDGITASSVHASRDPNISGPSGNNEPVACPPKKRKIEPCERSLELHSQEETLLMEDLCEKDLQVVIVYRGDPSTPLRSHHVTFIKQHIEDQLASELSHSPPQFERTEVSPEGHFVITCRNIETAQWVLALDIPSTDNQDFQPYPATMVPTAIILQFHVSNNALTTKDILIKLHQQNPMLDAKYWKVLKQETSSNLLQVTAPSDCLQVLKELSWRPYFGLERLPITLVTDSSSLPEVSNIKTEPNET